MIDLLLTIVFVAGCIYYFAKKKDLRPLSASLIAIAIQLTHQPLYLQRRYVFASIAILFGLMHLYLYTFKKKSENAYIFSLVFFLLGFVILLGR